MNDELRDLLARVVPEAPDGVASAAPVVTAGRRSRRRRVGVVGAAVLLAAAVVIVAGVASHDGPAVVAPATTPSLDPYTPTACPTIDVGHRRFHDGPVDLGDVRAIRLCNAVTGKDVAPQDALVTHLDDLAAAVPSLPDSPASCAGGSDVATLIVVQLDLADGSTPAVSADPCDDITIDGHTVDARAFEQAVLTQLDAQRTASSYTTSPTPLTSCDEPVTTGPVRPGREVLVAAAACLTTRPTPFALSAAQLAELNAAWDTPGPITDADFSCLGDMVRGPILAATDRGDRIALRPTCTGALAFDDRRIPMSVAGLYGPR